MIIEMIIVIMGLISLFLWGSAMSGWMIALDIIAIGLAFVAAWLEEIGLKQDIKELKNRLKERGNKKKDE